MNGASVIYTDCTKFGQPSTFLQFTDTLCQTPSLAIAAPTPVTRTCLGGFCGANGFSFKCNAVVRVTAPSTCLPSPDLNGNGVVDLSDIVVLLSYWGKCTPSSSYKCYQADLNCDGVIDLSDISVLLSYWG
jgi:hypothetical protein